MDLLFHPWFHGMPGTFSPAGGWVASFEVPGTGRHYLIHLALSHEVDHSPQGGVSSALDGSADVCMLGGQPVEFPDAVYSPSNGVTWTGSRTML